MTATQARRRTGARGREVGDCGYRVLRGGSWGSRPGNLRSAVRDRVASGLRVSHIGFRVSRTLD